MPHSSNMYALENSTSENSGRFFLHMCSTEVLCRCICHVSVTLYSNLAVKQTWLRDYNFLLISEMTLCISVPVSCTLLFSSHFIYFKSIYYMVDQITDIRWTSVKVYHADFLTEILQNWKTVLQSSKQLLVFSIAQCLFRTVC